MVSICTGATSVSITHIKGYHAAYMNEILALYIRRALDLHIAGLDAFG